MAKVKLADGTEVEMLTPEEAKAQADKALEDYKKDHPEKTPEQIAADQKKAEEDAAAAKAAAEGKDPVTKLSEELESVKTSLRQKEIAEAARTYAGADPAKQSEFKKAFERLTGYESTPEGMAEQAQAAARLIGIDPAGVDLSGVSGTGGGRNIDQQKGPQATQADKIVQTALGITEEDVKKFGPEAAKLNGQAPAAEGGAAQ